jgi:sugar/nucleoside kinase (ribokinase family)
MRPGGAALYAAVTADRLGVSAGILTSHGDDFPLEHVPSRIEVVSVPSPRTTTFVHAVQPSASRHVAVDDVAAQIGPEDIPDDWRDAPLVLLAPVLREVDPRLAVGFPDATIAAMAKGWLRDRSADGAIVPVSWRDAGLAVSQLQALFISGEHALDPDAGILDVFQEVPLGVIMAGSRGAVLFVNGERYEVRPARSREVDAVCAEEVFATTFMLRYARDGNPWDAAAAAACAAALSLEGEGHSAIPDAVRLEEALRQYERAIGDTP